MKLIGFICLAFITQHFLGQSPVTWSGQLSAWANVNNANDQPLWVGGRFIPQINIDLNQGDDRKFDFEASANLNGMAGFEPQVDPNDDATLRPYRLWARYSAPGLELRAGLQKINFGSAALVRPLMWFDQVDPRDPLQLTNGVWGLLGRYYFPNNANIWGWVLYGNDQAKTWEVGNTSQQAPEWGGRIQMPAGSGEMALSFHHRNSVWKATETSPSSDIPENRVGIDGKWDIGPGIWMEAAMIHKNRDVGDFTNQHILTVGADYTFGIGNGLNAIVEQLVFSYHQQAFRLNKSLSFSAGSFSYPLGLNDQVTALIYYDWTNHGSYNLISWNRNFNNLSLHVMLFKNPEKYNVPLYSSRVNLFAGSGVQVMGAWSL